MRDRPRERRRPAHGLTDVHDAFSEGRFQSTVRVLRHLSIRGRGRSTIGSCVQSLTPGDFHKSQRYLGRPEVWLDIYKPVFRGERLYVKFTLLEDGETYLVLSFCGDDEEH